MMDVSVSRHVVRVCSRDERCARMATRATLALQPDLGVFQGWSWVVLEAGICQVTCNTDF